MWLGLAQFGMWTRLADVAFDANADPETRDDAAPIVDVRSRPCNALAAADPVLARPA
jgi:hypothetical protein